MRWRMESGIVIINYKSWDDFRIRGAFNCYECYHFPWRTKRCLGSSTVISFLNLQIAQCNRMT